MSRAPGGERRGGNPPPGDPVSSDPALDHLIKALTAKGHPHEQASRAAALTAFRAASERPGRAGLSVRVRQFAAHGYSGGPRRRLRVLPARLTAISAAGFLTLGGVAAAAYAQVLPAPVQQIAHSVLAPLGVPDSKPVSGADSHLPSRGAQPSATYPVSVATSSGSAPAPGSSGSAGSGSAAATGPAASTAPALGAGHYDIALTAARARVAAGLPDLFTAVVSSGGQPASGLHVRLVERIAGSPAWQWVGSGVTGGLGRVRIWGPAMTVSASFRLVAPGGDRSPAVSVTVGPDVRLRLVSGLLRDRLIVAAPGGAPGAPVDLMELVGGTWETVAGKPLGPRLRAVFVLPASSAGHLYRVSLPDSTTPASAVSNWVWVPRHRGTGAGALHPSSPSPSPSATATPSATPTS